jgi:diguanylate cyclase (GGDEF)-like protein
VNAPKRSYVAVAVTEIAFGTVGLLLGAFAPSAPASRLAAASIGIAVILLGVATAWLGPRIPADWGLDISIGVGGGLVAASTLFMQTAQGQMSKGMLILAICVLAGTIRPKARVLALLAWMLVVYDIAWLLNPRIEGVVDLVMVNAIIAVVTSVVLWMGHRLRMLAHRDPLTGALNRRGLDLLAQDRMAAGKRGASSATVLVLDLDDFKGFNDRYGHSAGDALLAEVAAAWRWQLAPEDLLIRIGGDEFAIIFPAASQGQVEEVVQRLQRAHSTSWCFGLAVWDLRESLDTVLASADREMYAAKRRPKADREVSGPGYMSADDPAHT